MKYKLLITNHVKLPNSVCFSSQPTITYFSISLFRTKTSPKLTNRHLVHHGRRCHRISTCVWFGQGFDSCRLVMGQDINVLYMDLRTASQGLQTGPFLCTSYPWRLWRKKYQVTYLCNKWVFRYVAAGDFHVPRAKTTDIKHFHLWRQQYALTLAIFW